MNEMDHKFGKIVIFSKQYEPLAHKLILEYVLKVKKCNFSSLQNSFKSRQAEYPLKTNISVEKFNEYLIE